MMMMMLLTLLLSVFASGASSLTLPCLSVFFFFFFACHCTMTHTQERSTNLTFQRRHNVARAFEDSRGISLSCLLDQLLVLLLLMHKLSTATTWTPFSAATDNGGGGTLLTTTWTWTACVRTRLAHCFFESTGSSASLRVNHRQHHYLHVYVCRYDHRRHLMIKQSFLAKKSFLGSKHKHQQQQNQH